ncbi:HET-domain-containing protein [Xylaria sp. FL1042]|nr:HET-domain-containing protein [Xylaria sp. FL1042]
MENISDHGATLLGQRLGACMNGIWTAHLTLFFDWVTPSWCKTAYVVFDHLYRARRTNRSLVASKIEWQYRLLVFSSWMSMCIAYLVWAPKRRLIMIYHGVTGHALNLLLWLWNTMRNDGPRDMTNKVYDAFFDTALSFFISSYSLTHPALVWKLVKWGFIRLGIPFLCISVPLYYFREYLQSASTYSRVWLYIFLFINRAWDMFDYVEAQVVERLPRYLQHRWSSYQQGLPERARLPTYQYKPLNVGEIRLLVLKRSPFYPSVIQATIVHLPIYPPPDYEALSYRWGSSELTEEILVDGYRFPVTKAAFELLLMRRSVWRARVLWIDAICINQEDVQEKSEQVQLMRDIYHRASRVIAYPGGDWRARIAGSFILQLWSLIYQYNTDKMDWSGIQEESHSPQWRAIADLFSNSYFNRTWVIQEIAVGRNTELYIGGTYIPWRVFSEVVAWSFKSNRKCLLNGSDNKDMSTWQTGQTFENILAMTILRPEVEGWDNTLGNFHHVLDLENILFITFKFRSGDPRDKVFGVIGIARNVGDPAFTTPDYSLSVEQVFQNAARAIFSLLRDRRTIHVLSLAGTGFSERRRKLPSWVPDFSEERMCYSYSNILKQDGDFKASGDLPQGLEIDYITNSLIIKATTIDQVLDISEFGPLDWKLHDLELVDALKILPILRGFVQAAINLCEKYPGSSEVPDQRTYERLWLALITGQVEKKRADMKFKKVFQY